MAAAIGPTISGIASLAGAMVSASAKNAQADQEEQIARWNAERQREKAALAQAKGAQESRVRQEEGEAAASRHRAVVAQGGASTTEGTPLLMQQEFAKDTFYNTEVAMFNAKTEQADLKNKASVTEWEGKVRADATRAQASASLISGFPGAAKGVAGAFG